MTSNWLAQLAPDHAPPPPGWWPPAPGWWGVALLIVVLVAGLAWWWRNPHRRRRRAALRELRVIREAAAEDALTARAVENLLRRHAVAVFGVERVARLSGAAWLRFLSVEGGDLFAADTGRSLLATAFGSHAHGERDRWLAAADKFIRRAARARRARRSDR